MAVKKTSAMNRVSAAQVRADEAKHLMNTYKRPPVLFTHGRGCRLYDSDGKEYLDFLGGIAVNALGYSHPRLVQSIRREAGRAIHLSNLFHNPFQGPLAKKLAQWSGLDRVFFTNSGTEAIDGALKLARAYAKAGKAENKKIRILALENSFHGRTFGALSITYPAKYREPFAPLVPGVEFVKFNDVADLEAKFDGTVCAFIVETIQGEGGIYPVSPEFWARARAAGRPARRGLHRRRNPMRTGPHRPLFRVSEIRFAAGHRNRREAAGRRPAAGRFHRQRRIRIGVCRRGCTGPLLAAGRWSAPRLSNS